MARITTKKHIAAKQMKKNGDCISEDKPGGAVSDCVTGEGRKQTTANRACGRFGGNVGHQKLCRRKQRKKHSETKSSANLLTRRLCYDIITEQ